MRMNRDRSIDLTIRSAISSHVIFEIMIKIVNDKKNTIFDY